MPELPEIETIRQGLSPVLINQSISEIILRHHQLRHPLQPEIDHLCRGKKIVKISRRGKYLLFQLSQGYLLIHLGMSGQLNLVSSEIKVKKHDHIDLRLNNGLIVRYHDPRRFGLCLYLEDPSTYDGLKDLGPEPLSSEFNAEYLQEKAKNKTQKAKSFIMDNRIIVGVGNIYATESLFFAGVHPCSAAGTLKEKQVKNLVAAIKQVLNRAIAAGGTTLRDFQDPQGKPGYFIQQLQIYGRKGQPCFKCHSLIETVVISNRSSSFCPTCQALCRDNAEPMNC